MFKKTLQQLEATDATSNAKEIQDLQAQQEHLDIQTALTVLEKYGDQGNQCRSLSSLDGNGWWFRWEGRAT